MPGHNVRPFASSTLPLCLQARPPRAFAQLVLLLSLSLQASAVCLRAPVSESLSRLQRDQLQKFAQYLISELPQQVSEVGTPSTSWLRGCIISLLTRPKPPWDTYAFVPFPLRSSPQPSVCWMNSSPPSQQPSTLCVEPQVSVVRKKGSKKKGSW